MANAFVVYNNSRGYVVEQLDQISDRCESWLLLPAENLWHEGARGTLYLLGLIYLFMGIAIASDLFMSAIEVITSKKRTVVRWDEEKQIRVEKEILVWNETVANLTLMALGSSIPEILLAVLETVQNLDKDVDQDGLGVFTIIGSAAFNLLIITAICVLSVPNPDVKIIKEFGVFALTSAWSIFAYLWMLIVVAVISPGVIEPWEAWLTLAYLPAMVLTAYCQDCGWWMNKCCKKQRVEDDAMQSQMNVRIVHANHHGNFTHTGPSKELHALEKEKTHIRHSHANLKAISSSRGNLEESGDYLVINGHLSRPISAASIRSGASGTIIHIGADKPRLTRNSNENIDDKGSQSRLIKLGPDDNANKNLSRARFRHAAVRSMLGGKKKTPVVHHKPKFTEVVDAVTHSTMTPGYLPKRPTAPKPEELVGKFTFAAPSYSVLESAGTLEVEILFHRKPPITQNTKIMNGGMNGTMKNKETAFNGNDTYTGVVEVEFETREGSGKFDHDFKFTQGKLKFQENEWKKTIHIPIINDDQYEADKDFYIFLKSPCQGTSVGDPSVTRVTIIDDDEPGEFQFEHPHYYADLKGGVVTVTVLRQRGCDGNVSVEYSTIDGTAKGGEKLEKGSEYKKAEGLLEFKHGETSKNLSFDVVTNAKGSKNFIVTLRNPSLGAKIGEHSATVANITVGHLAEDDMAERLAELIDEDEEELTWGGQFKSAMVLESDKDDDGNEVPLKWYDYLLHFLTFLWKVLFAFVPPTSYLGAYPTFIGSLLGVVLLIALVEQIATLLGCVIGLKAAVSGITLIAFGTSVPDTFASRTAALHDEYADAAIGNVTGSNSVNVFLGLGLPWVIKTMYLLARNKTYQVERGNLVSSVVIFTIVGSICLILLVIRRKFVGGELGGKNKVIKYLTGIFLIVLWFIYIILASVKAYHPDALPW